MERIDRSDDSQQETQAIQEITVELRSDTFRASSAIALMLWPSCGSGSDTRQKHSGPTQQKCGKFLNFGASQFTHRRQLYSAKGLLPLIQDHGPVLDHIGMHLQRLGHDLHQHCESGQSRIMVLKPERSKTNNNQQQNRNRRND